MSDPGLILGEDPMDEVGLDQLLAGARRGRQHHAQQLQIVLHHRLVGQVQVHSPEYMVHSLNNILVHAPE